MSYDLSNTLFTPSDQFDLAPRDAAVLDKSTGAQITTFPFTVSFGGDMLVADGTFMVDVINTAHSNEWTGVEIYDRNLNLIASLGVSDFTGLNDSVNNAMTIFAHQLLDCFFVAWYGNSSTRTTTRIAKISKAGVILQTWSVGLLGTETLSPAMSVLGISPDGTYAYFNTDNGFGAPKNSIRQYNLISNTYVGELIAGVAGKSLGLNMYVLDDGSIMFMRNSTPLAHYDILVYSAAGALLHTYSLGDLAGKGDKPLFGREEGITDRFWVHTFPDVSNNTGNYDRKAYADGSADVSFTIQTRNSGLTNTPLSCPFFVFGDGTTQLLPTDPSIACCVTLARARKAADKGRG